MATEEETKQALLDRIHAIAPDVRNTASSQMVLQLAEAYAWLRHPGQPHGGSATIKS